MLKYIWMDLTAAIKYLPIGLAVGILFAIVLLLFDFKRKRMNGLQIFSLSAYAVYAVIILCLTFWSRENGSRNGIDLTLFSTWGINARNNAYVIENILLFIPYGIISPFAFPIMRRFIISFLFGFSTSLFIEYIQFVTKRGYFQVDDILTNTLGNILGFIIFSLLYLIFRKMLGKKTTQ